MTRARLSAPALLFLGVAAVVSLGGTSAPRPATWAQPVAARHLKNFYQLDAKLYRSAQPRDEGFREAAALGIRSVLSLRDHHDDRHEAQDTGLALYRVPMEAGDIRRADVVKALRVLRAAEGPVLVHCWHGSDRTGLLCAMYRIVFQGWDRAEALRELTEGGYGHHEMFDNIPRFIREVDLEALKRDVLAP